MDLKGKKNDRGHNQFVEQMYTSYSHSTIKKLISRSDARLARLDKPLLVFKAFYFFLFGSMATTFPFLPLYFGQIGFSGSQIQVLACVRPFVQLFMSPLWGIMADRCLPKKMILQFCTFVWLIGTISLAFVEPTGQMCQLLSLNETDSKVINSTEMQTGFFRRRRATEYFTMQSKLIPREHNGNSSNEGFESIEIAIGSGSGNSQTSESDASGSGLLINAVYQDKELNITHTNKTHGLITFSSSQLKSNSIDTPTLIEFNFTIRNELKENTSRLYHIFLGALALAVFEEIFLCPVLFVADSVLLAKQIEKSQTTTVYGHQRFFGSMGFLIFFLITGTLVNNSQRPVCGHIYADYIINFCFFCMMTIFMLLVLIKFEVQCRVPEDSPCERLKVTYNNKHFVSFIAAAAFMGFSHKVISQFHTSYLAEANLGHSKSATINAFRLLGEPLALFVSHKLIYHVGSVNMIFASLVLYMFNHFACSFASSPWQVIPLGFLEGFTSGSSFVVCVTYLASSSPLDYITTVQGKGRSFFRFY